MSERWNEKINGLTADIAEEVVHWRRDLHRFPELATEEYRTAHYIEDNLKRIGITDIRRFFDTGVVAVIRGEQPGKTVALRFDLDALPIEERTEHAFVSENPGVMHACGHDGHMAIGLGCAKLLFTLRRELKGRIKLIFQPAEEGIPGGGGGAEPMIGEGVLKSPDVDWVVGGHLWPDREIGVVATKPGPIMAAVDNISLTVHGKGVHAALPHKGIDPIQIGAQIVCQAQSLISRRKSPFTPAVLSFGFFHAGTASNIIPATAEIKGTLRTFDEHARKELKERFTALCQSVAAAHGGSVDLQIRPEYPVLNNDHDLALKAIESVRTILGQEYGVIIDHPVTGGEDFAFFAQRKPSVYLFIGYGEPGVTPKQPHMPDYDFHEGALTAGVKSYVRIVSDLLAQEN